MPRDELTIILYIFRRSFARIMDAQKIISLFNLKCREWIYFKATFVMLKLWVGKREL